MRSDPTPPCPLPARPVVRPARDSRRFRRDRSGPACALALALLTVLGTVHETAGQNQTSANPVRPLVSASASAPPSAISQRGRAAALRLPPGPSPVPTAVPNAAAPSQLPVQGLSAGAAARPSMASSDYLLQSSDVVTVSVFQEPELTTTTRVAADGTIAFPLIGRVSVGGRTAIGAGEAIRQLLDADYIVNPQVTVSVIEVSKRYFTILGQVGRPGTYELPAAGSLPILQAIGLAGGFTRVASPARMTVRRTGPDGQDQVIRIDGKKGGRDPEGNLFEVRPGDTIEVPESLL